ncbi:MLO-like protein 1 [Camellia sinensis]|uniref:MLO-like protein 1 n=1 Tax=Camellia sinensis TaxID=4442 RepID=UPI001036A1FE|nr:MLO-like protein 1 [Camellia sinensis]
MIQNKYSFFKQFYGSVTRSDYMTLRLGFIMTHCRGNPKFNFHKYMIRALEDDFKKVVGIRQVITGITCLNAKASYGFFCLFIGQFAKIN